MIHLGKRAALSDALVVLRGVVAYDLRLFHLNAEMLPYKVNGRKDGEKESRLQQRGPPISLIA